MGQGCRAPRSYRHFDSVDQVVKGFEMDLLANMHDINGYALKARFGLAELDPPTMIRRMELLKERRDKIVALNRPRRPAVHPQGHPCSATATSATAWQTSRGLPTTATSTWPSSWRDTTTSSSTGWRSVRHAAEGGRRPQPPLLRPFFLDESRAHTSPTSRLAPSKAHRTLGTLLVTW